MISKARTMVTFYNGLRTIGGPMIEVIYGKSHVLFDLGEVYRPELNLPNENYETLIENELIGDVPDFYDPAITNKKIDTDKWTNAAAYISHVHLDHSKALNLLAPEIPLYTGSITARQLPVLNEKGDFLLPAVGHNASYTRPIIAAEYYEPIEVGNITLEIWPSDHDAYGATGLIIKTPDKMIAYTGDIRLHGYHPDRVNEFLKAAKHCDLLITEGTGFSWPEEKPHSSAEFTGPKNEKELIAEVVNLQKNNPKRQITFNTYPTNVERLLQLGKESVRKMVLHAKRAHFLKASLDKNYLYYYLPEENKFADLNQDLEVPYAKLLQDKEKYFWQVVDNFSDLQAGGLYIHSNAEPLGSFDPEYAPFVAQFAAKKIEFRSLRCSGHADKDELAKIIQKVSPKLLVPVHSLHPELIKNPDGKRILPKRGQTVTL